MWAWLKSRWDEEEDKQILIKVLFEPKRKVGLSFFRFLIELLVHSWFDPLITPAETNLDFKEAVGNQGPSAFYEKPWYNSPELHYPCYPWLPSVRVPDTLGRGPQLLASPLSEAAYPTSWEPQAGFEQYQSRSRDHFTSKGTMDLEDRTESTWKISQDIFTSDYVVVIQVVFYYTR